MVRIYNKYYYHRKNTTTNSITQKKIKNNLTTSFKIGPQFTDETEIESTMVVIGKFLLTRKRNVTNESQSAASNEVIIEGPKKKRNYALQHTQNKSKKITKPNQLCLSISKGIECPSLFMYLYTYYSQIEHCQLQ